MDAYSHLPRPAVASIIASVFKAWRSAWRSGALLVLIVAVSGIGWTAWRGQGPTPTRVIEVQEVAASGCGVFGNQTCHLVATTEGEVLTVGDNSWVVVQPWHCYRVTLGRLDGDIYNARQVDCPANAAVG